VATNLRAIGVKKEITIGGVDINGRNLGRNEKKKEKELADDESEC